MKTILYFIGLVVLLSASECKQKNVNLTGTQWKVLELRQPNATSTQQPTRDYVLTFKDEKSLNIKLDINNCFSGYQVAAPGKIAIQPLACTKACCDSEFAMQIAAMLSQMKTFQVRKNMLLLAGDGKITLKKIE